jgi:hypothetical protein
MAKYQLNVVLHGTWGIENNPDAIYIVTIEDDHHVIKAGDRCTPQFDLGANTNYKLVGVTEGTPANFRRDLNPTIDNRMADRRRVQVVIRLPYPREIHSVRLMDTNGHEFFKNNFPATPRQIATAQVLVYDVENLDAVRLEGTEWRAQPNSGVPTVVNLHLYADPDWKAHKAIQYEIARGGERLAHATMVLEKLAHAFDLEIAPLRLSDAPPKLEDQIIGLTDADTTVLWECGPQAAVSPDNCDFLLAVNRGQD